MKRLNQHSDVKRKNVNLTYITSRGLWYYYSWKGKIEQSGGIGTNIGIHFFDLLMWLFGKPDTVELHLREENRMGGFMELPGRSEERRVGKGSRAGGGADQQKNEDQNGRGAGRR